MENQIYFLPLSRIIKQSEKNIKLHIYILIYMYKYKERARSLKMQPCLKVKIKIPTQQNNLESIQTAYAHIYYILVHYTA